MPNCMRNWGRCPVLPVVSEPMSKLTGHVAGHSACRGHTAKRPASSQRSKEQEPNKPRLDKRKMSYVRATCQFLTTG
jgi:hypothetical protein